MAMAQEDSSSSILRDDTETPAGNHNDKKSEAGTMEEEAVETLRRAVMDTRRMQVHLSMPLILLPVAPRDLTRVSLKTMTTCVDLPEGILATRKVMARMVTRRGKTAVLKWRQPIWSPKISATSWIAVIFSTWV